MGRFSRKWLAVFLAMWLCVVGPQGASAAQLFLKDGRILQGKLGLLSGLAEVPKAPSPDGSGPLQLIALVDDDLRRTFVSKRQVVEFRQEDPAEVLEKFRIRQRVLRGGATIQSVGAIVRITPFDEFGRRIFTMNTVRGQVNVIQGITEITPRWTKVEGLTHIWDMRMATTAIPPATLGKILARQIQPGNVEDRKKIARFYLQSERYEDAYAELEAILKDSGDDPEIREQLAPSIRAIRQLSAQRLFSELKLRRAGGQHGLVLGKLQTFPADNVAGEILQAVREMIREYETLEAQRVALLEQFDGLFGQVDEEALRERIRPVRQELDAGLNLNTLDRMAAFRQMADDQGLLATERLALAISGWLLGSNSATSNLPVALSAFDVRELVRQYLNAPDRLTHARILEQFYSQEAGTPALVAKLIAHMQPPIDTPPPETDRPGYYELEVAGLGSALPVRYLVQLPPEYDPYRRYPAIITLHGAGTTASHQVDWWAGDWAEGGWRKGQAARHGTIVIAPDWTSEHQRKYQYSAREHAAVLDCLRDACRRFAVDTDRVYLTGHSIGGDAAWDLGLAHPDLWAGVIPIVAESDRYCTLYWENAKLVPFYFVCGEKDGGKMVRNARDLDRYLKRGYNATVVEYLGRGHENFSDEILRLFDWMGRFKRDFFPREFTASTMRSWDNFFWWIELAHLPSRALVDPFAWPPPRGTQAVETTASVTATNGIYVRTGSGKVTVWLSPEMLNFERRITITVNGQRVDPGNPFAEPHLETLLEDVRTRGDRQHPFWVKVEAPTGRVQPGR